MKTALPELVGLASTADIVSSAEAPMFHSRVYDGGLLKVAGVDLPVIVDIKGVRRSDGQLHAFRNRAPVGHLDLTFADGIELLGHLSVPGEARDNIIEAADNGFQHGVRLATKLLDEEHIPAGQQITVNGQTFDGPLIVARRADVEFLSFGT